jgi:3-isopropylmalate dehydrogenase
MTMYKIALLPGDGIGPEQTQATKTVLEAVEKKIGIQLKLIELEGGDICLEKRGISLPDSTIEGIRKSDACLKGPVGESAADVIVRLRLMFDLYVNLRPVKTYPNVDSLKPNIDFVVVRENTEDLYRGLEFTINPDTAVALRVITRGGTRRIAEFAFNLARQRNKKLTAVHKSNVMRVTDGLFSEAVRDVAKSYPDVEFSELYVDAASMQFIKRPETFDVVLTPNLFGDILSDEAAQLVGGLGMAPGANIGKDFALFEPVHGSAPKYAGKQVANPCSMILASYLMFDWLGRTRGDELCTYAGKAVDQAVVETLREGILTPDLGGNNKTYEVGEAVAERIKPKGSID